MTLHRFDEMAVVGAAEQVTDGLPVDFCYQRVVRFEVRVITGPVVAEELGVVEDSLGAVISIGRSIADVPDHRPVGWPILAYGQRSRTLKLSRGTGWEPHRGPTQGRTRQATQVRVPTSMAAD